MPRLPELTIDTAPPATRTTAAEIVELTAIGAFENFRSKFNHALQIESNGLCLLKQARGMHENRGQEP